jgi:hypothetical protein
MIVLSPVVAATVITEPPAHCFTVSQAHEGAGFGIVISCAGCLDPSPLGEAVYEWTDVSGTVIFDPPDPGDTAVTLNQLRQFLIRHRQDVSG